MSLTFRSYLLPEEARELACPWTFGNPSPDIPDRCQGAKCAAWVWLVERPADFAVVDNGWVHKDWVDALTKAGCELNPVHFRNPGITKHEVATLSWSTMANLQLMRPPEVDGAWVWEIDIPAQWAGWVEDPVSLIDRRVGRCCLIPLPDEGETL